MKMQRNAASGKLQVDVKKKARQAVARDRHRRTKKELGNRVFRGSLVWPGPGLVQVKGGACKYFVSARPATAESDTLQVGRRKWEHCKW